MTLAEMLEGEEAGSGPVGAELEAALERFEKELDALDGDELDDAVRRTTQLRAQLEAVEVGLIGRFDRSHAWSRAGYRHPTQWIRTECRQQRSAAGKRVALSRKLRDMPHTAAAFAAGQIDITHVDRLARCNSPARAPQFAIAEAALVASACTQSFEEFQRTVDYFEQEVDPDPDGTEEDRDAKRRAHSSKMFNGLGKVDTVLGPVDWSVFDTTLRRIDKELFEADWAACVEQHGDQASTALLPRSARQRRAHALVEMARRAAAMSPAMTAPKPLAIVHIDLETFEAELERRVGAAYEYPPRHLCELQDGTVISPGRALELAMEGHVRRMVFDPGRCLPRVRAQGEVLHRGPTRDDRGQRPADARGNPAGSFEFGLRPNIAAEECDVPWWDCDIDHVVDWQHDGESNGDNGKLKCRWHNGHKSEYTITTDPVTGRIRWRRHE